MKKYKLLIGLFLSLIVLIIVEYVIYINYGSLTTDETNISFVVSGDNLDDFENMKLGAEAAALDKHCVINFVNSPYENGAEGEYEVIKRQLSEGSDYVVVASSYEDEVAKLVKKNKLDSQVKFINNPDDYKLGKDFVEYISTNSEDKRFLVLTTQTTRKTDLLKGLEDSLQESGINYEVKELADDEGFLSQQVFNYQQSGLYDGLITLDSSLTDAVADNFGVFSKRIDVFGVDNRQEAVYYLDTGVLKALGFKDDYSLGYITVNSLLSGKSFNRVSKGIPLYYVVDKNSMYSDRMEKVLFPFVK